MVTYTVQVEPQKEGGYTVTVPALPGCISEGETLEDALENIQDAVEGYIHVLAKHNRLIPMEFSESHIVEVFKKGSKGKRKKMTPTYA